KLTPVGRIASIVRIDDPTEIHFSSQTPDEPGHGSGYITNHGGQVAYYAIDRQTMKPVHVGTSYPHRFIAEYPPGQSVTVPAQDARFPFFIWKPNLFEAADKFFPKPEDKNPDNK